jgi:hypothetical protein
LWFLKFFLLKNATLGETLASPGDMSENSQAARSPQKVAQAEQRAVALVAGPQVEQRQAVPRLALGPAQRRPV